MSPRLLLLLLLALLLPLAAALLLEGGGKGGGGGGGAVDVAVLSCTNETVAAWARTAARGLNLSTGVVEPGAPLPPGVRVLVVDAEACRPWLREAAQSLAMALREGATALIVGRPRRVSALIKAQHRVLMAYPLPYINETIIYAIHVVRFDPINRSLATPEAAYWKHPSPQTMRKALEFVLTHFQPQPMAAASRAGER